jgi:hypothetical protein
MASLLALLSSGLWGSADYHAGKLSKRFPAVAVLATSQAIGFITGVVLVLLTLPAIGAQMLLAMVVISSQAHLPALLVMPA